MKDLKLTEVLNSLTSDEIKRLRKFVDSPYHNGSKNVTKFFNEVIKFYPGFTSKNYNFKYIHSKLFPSKKYHEGVLRNLASDLYKLAEEFLVTDNILNKNIEYNLYLLKELRERELTDLFRINYKKSKARLESGTKDDIYMYNLYQLESEYWSLYLVDKKTGKKHNEFVMKTVDNTELLSKFFLSRMLISYCSIVSNSVDFKVKPRLKFYDEIKAHIGKQNFDDSPFIKLYFESLKLSLGDEDETVFEKLHSGIKRNRNNLSHDHLHVLYINLLNHAIIKKKFSVCFVIINEILKGKYYSREGGIMEMEYGFYSAAVHSGLLLKKYNWVESFIKNYREKIHKPHRENIHHYHSALFEFIKKNFDKSVDLLNKLNPTDFFLLIYAQRLRLALYYELGRTEEIYYLIDSFKHTLSRHSQVEERHGKIYKDFLHDFTELLKLTEKFDDYRCSILKKELAKRKEQSVFCEWLIAKLESLGKF